MRPICLRTLMRHRAGVGALSRCHTHAEVQQALDDLVEEGRLVAYTYALSSTGSGVVGEQQYRPR